MLMNSFNRLPFRRVFTVFLILIMVGTSAYQAPKEKRVRKVVIDAGHGGKDPGTLGKKLKEKDVALSVALKLGKYIKENYKDVEVIYTRTTDVFIELYRRAKIANENHADLFISIHCNGTKSPQAKGTETWVMGLHKSKENLEVAKLENAAILKEDDYNQYDGFDPQSPEATIIFSLYQNSYLDQSLDLASRVQNQFRDRLKLGDRGVKQAGFWVLYKTTMPGILVELGFLSNPDDERFLSKQNNQEQVAYSIFLAFRDYKEGIDGVNVPLLTSPPPPVTDEPDSVETSAEPAPKPVIPEKKESAQPVNTPVESGVVWRIQIVSSDKPLKENSPVFKGIQEIHHYLYKGGHKYTTGACKTFDEALILQKKMIAKGFKDAFIVPFMNNERIGLEEAKKLSPN